MKYLLAISLFLSFCLAPIGTSAQEKGAAPLSPTHSLTGSPIGTTRAVIIGISDYQDPAIPDLRFADRDAEAFADFLRSPAGGSLDGDHLKLLTNEEATAGEVAASLDWLLEQSHEGDFAIIYFSGHGDVERKTISQPGFLLCWDSRAQVYMGGGTYPLDYLQEIIMTLSIQKRVKVVVVTDACHAGKLAGSQIGGPQATTSNLAKQFANEIKVLSCQPNEYSVEGEQWGGGRGAFSYHLVDGLYGMADREGDGAVTLSDIDRYLEDHVTKEVAEQTPMIVGNKNERLAEVFPEVLAMWKKSKEGQPSLFKTLEQRGLEDETLAKVDTSITQLYYAFKKAVKEKVFFEPLGTCANAFYEQLMAEKALKPLHSTMTRNYAAALQDDAQQALNAILDADSLELVRLSRADDKYRLYPTYLEKAAELLGERHYMYKTLVARQRYFEGLYLRLYFNAFKNDSLINAAIEKQQQALNLDERSPHVYLEMGRLFRAKGEFEKARVSIKKAIELSPTWVTPYFDFWGIIDVEEAYELIKKAIGLKPNCTSTQLAHLYYGFGLYSMFLDKLEEAEAAFREAIVIKPDFQWPKGQLAKMYEEMGRFEESEELLEKNLRLNSNDHLSYISLGATKFQVGKVKEAIQLYKRGFEIYPGNWAARAELSMLLYKAGYKKEALDAAESIIQLTIFNPSFFYSAAHIFREVGLYKEAIQILRLQIEEYSGLETYQNFLESYILSCNVQEGMKEAQKALEKFPTSPGLKLSLGKLLYKNKEFEKLEATCLEIVESAPNDALIPNDIGEWYKNNGNFELAEHYLKLSLERNKRLHSTYLYLSELYYAYGKYQEAIHILDDGLKARPNQSLLRQRKAVMSYLCLSPEKSKQLFQEEETQRPGFMKMWEFLEQVRLGKYEDAVSTWQEIDRAFETQYLLHFYLGALVQKGDMNTAIEALQTTGFYSLLYQNLSTYPLLEPLRQRQEYKNYIWKNFPEKFDEPAPDSLWKENTSHPFMAYYCRFMGSYCRQKNQPQEAIQWFLKSLEIEPGNPYAKLFLAGLYLDLGQFKEALIIVPDSLNSENFIAHYDAGAIYYQLGRKALAEYHFQRFLDIFNEGGDYNAVGIFYENHGEPALAERYFNESIRLQPDAMGYRRTLARLCFFSGQQERAFRVLEEAIQKEPGQVATLALRAFLHYFHDPEGTEVYFREVNALSPGFISIWNSLELMRDNQFEQAEIAWKEVQGLFDSWWMAFPKYAFLQMKVRQGEHDTAMTLLENLMSEDVLANYTLLSTDTALNPLRRTARFRDLMKKYFPEKVKD